MESSNMRLFFSFERCEKSYKRSEYQFRHIIKKKRKYFYYEKFCAKHVPPTPNSTMESSNMRLFFSFERCEKSYKRCEYQFRHIIKKILGNIFIMKNFVQNMYPPPLIPPWRVQI